MQRKTKLGHVRKLRRAPEPAMRRIETRAQRFQRARACIRRKRIGSGVRLEAAQRTPELLALRGDDLAFLDVHARDVREQVAKTRQSLPPVPRKVRAGEERVRFRLLEQGERIDAS